MEDLDLLADRFEAERSYLRGIAYRMLGTASEADDAVQEAWLRLSRSDAAAIGNLTGWLTTVVGRICLDMLRSRTSRREDPLGASVLGAGGSDPAEEAVLADEVGLALLVVLDRLSPAERVAFVLHDLFAVPFDQVALIVERTPVAAKKLASRARHRVHASPTIPAVDVARHRQVVEAFIAATRDGDLRALVALLDPDVVRRADRQALPKGILVLRGSQAVAEDTRTNMARARAAAVALVDGRVGLVVAPRGKLQVAIRLGIRDDRITEIDIVREPAALGQLSLALVS